MTDYNTGSAAKVMTDIAPLSFAQQRIWFLHQLQPDGPLYNVFHSIRLSANINASALKQALKKLVVRHETLRTVFVLIDNHPYQKIQATGHVPLQEFNLFASADYRGELKKIAASEALKPFNLTAACPVRMSLVYSTPDESHLLVCMHHIITDAWSIDIFNRELKAMYEAAINGSSADLTPLKTQYRDYAIWQQQCQHTDAWQRQLAYWEKQLSDLPVLQLPFARHHSGSHLFRGRSKSFVIEARVYSQLKKLTEDLDQTLFITLLTAFKVLLFRYTGQNDIVVGCPVSGRNRKEWEELIGFFVNTIVIRSQLAGDLSFTDACREVQQKVLDGFDHQDIPFDELVKSLHPSRDVTKNPLFQVVFQLQSTGDHAAMMPPETSEPDIAANISKFDLTLSMTDSTQALRGTFEYNSDLFSMHSIDKLVDHFIQLLKKITDDYNAPLANLPLLKPSEEKTLKGLGAGTTALYSDNVFVHDLISAIAREMPQKTAICSQDGSITYGDLEKKSNLLANLLRSRGVQPGSRVIVCMTRSISMVVAHLAILKAGGAFVHLDAGYPTERLQFMLADIDAIYLISDIETVNKHSVVHRNLFVVERDWQGLERFSEDIPSAELTMHDTAYIMFTSGSTGRPKGVELMHQGFCNLVRWNIEAYSINGQDRCLQAATPAYDAYIFEMFPCLAAGATAYIVDDITRTSADLLSEYMVDKKINISFLSTAIGQAVMERLWNKDSSMRVFAVGGEKLVKLPPAQPGFRFLNFYGPTENAVMTTFYPVVIDGTSQYPPIGKAIHNVQLYVLDAFLNLMPQGFPGELYIGGKGVGQGYYKRPALTAEKFVPDPFADEPGNRLYRTGDLVRFNEQGNLEFIGRVDHQVKLRGFRIELDEIEKVLHEHPGVREAIVVMRQSVNGNHAVVAYLATHAATGISTSTLRAFVKEKLPAFMVPSSFVMLNQLPKSMNGKIDRNALPEPDAKDQEHENGFQAAETAMEKTIAAIWGGYLPTANISAEANFFDMGGHSLLMAQVHHQLKETLQTEIPLVVMFQYPTIRSLARHLEKTPAAAAPQQQDDRGFKQRQAFLRQKLNRKPV